MDTAVKNNWEVKINWEEVRDEISLKRVIQDSGRKLLRNNSFLCPAHSDKKPSASLIPQKNNQRWCCFSCGAGGSNIDYIMYLMGLKREEAAIYLGNAYGVGLTNEEKNESIIPMLPMDLLRKIGLQKNPFYPVSVRASIEPQAFGDWDFDTIPKEGYQKSMGKMVLDTKEAATLVANKCGEYLCSGKGTTKDKNKVAQLMAEMLNLVKRLNRKEKEASFYTEYDERVM